MIALLLAFVSGCFGGAATVLLLGCCRCAARELPPRDDARDARVFTQEKAETLTSSPAATNQGERL